MLRKVVLTAAVATIAMTASAATAAGGDDAGARSFTLRDVVVQQEFVDLGAAGPSLGDMVVFNDVLRRHAGGPAVGRVHGSCTLTLATAARQAFHCTATHILAGGSIEAAGTVFLVAANPERRNVVSITGGTGRFRGATGQIAIRQGGQPIEIFTYQLDR